jgi:hypothetical protein
MTTLTMGNKRKPILYTQSKLILGFGILSAIKSPLITQSTGPIGLDVYVLTTIILILITNVTYTSEWFLASVL